MMKKYITLIPCLLLIVLVGIVLGYNIWDGTRDKFQVGDCVEIIYETEFYRSVYYHRIDKVGKKAYLTSQKEAGARYFFDKKNFEWKFNLHKYDKVDTSNCEVDAL